MSDRAESTMHTKAKQKPEKQLDSVPCAHLPALIGTLGVVLRCCCCCRCLLPGVFVFIKLLQIRQLFFFRLC